LTVKESSVLNYSDTQEFVEKIGAVPPFLVARNTRWPASPIAVFDEWERSAICHPQPDSAGHDL